MIPLRPMPAPDTIPSQPAYQPGVHFIPRQGVKHPSNHTIQEVRLLEQPFLHSIKDAAGTILETRWVYPVREIVAPFLKHVLSEPQLNQYFQGFTHGPSDPAFYDRPVTEAAPTEAEASPVPGPVETHEGQ